MTIETERLILVPINNDYAKDMFANFNEEVTLYMSPHPAKNIEETYATIKSFIEKREKNTDYVYAIVLKGSREYIGCVGLHGLNNDTPELGIWTKISSHGNHFGREAIGGIIQFSKTLGIGKLIYPVDRRNESSRKIPIYFKGRVITECEEEITADGRVLEIETYEISI